MNTEMLKHGVKAIGFRILCCLLFMLQVNILGRIHIFANHAINFDCAILRISGKTDTFFTVIANFGRIEIANIAFSAFNALTIIQYTLFSHAASIPLSFLHAIIAQERYLIKQNMRTYV